MQEKLNCKICIKQLISKDTIPRIEMLKNYMLESATLQPAAH